MERVKVLVVDDSAFMRKLIVDFLSEHLLIEVVGTARNGEEALKKVEQLNPDMVTLDVEMPGMNGMEVLKKIMANKPLPVIMLSSTTKNGAENTLNAMQYGAYDFIAKPSGSISLDLHKVKQELVEKVLYARKANIQRFPIDRELPPEKQRETELIPRKATGKHLKKIVCIGTSTGGPRALQQVLTRLPKGMPAPVLIVQHMPAGFTKSLADRLHTLCKIAVKEAEDGEVLMDGIAYIAPGGFHLEVNQNSGKLQVHLSKEAPRSGHRPSVDVLFESAARIEGYTKIAVIMTGMGADGMLGLSSMKQRGDVKAIAESSESCVVFGMPKAAIAAKLIDEIKDAEDIASAIMQYI
ncbi:protein-glutamate methylesterase/protein-glutamine glutaminase [Bacillus massilinigeriensis]|uniref:protein-glutamate methylesterase/protein-glutamine glutaminase n=1 Tax=Bacillus mediterraneensis TaxID=1805474 RepID=UPI0008F8468A|nr:chemotaxis response regulator protein-glutamate methylesterase [Bacillus mediterraneensis]